MSGARSRKREGGDPSPLWTRRLIRSPTTDAPKPILANALTALREARDWQGVFGFDEFAQRVTLRSNPPWPSRGACNGEAWTSVYDVRTAEWLQHAGIIVSAEIASQAIDAIARDHPFHPVRNYLNGLSWDGTARLDEWAITFLGAGLNNANGDYLRAVSSRWLISAVARVFQPGAKADHCPIFEGEQGTKKSTALRRLFEPWFTDEIADLGTKDSSLQLCGVWCVEIAELDSMRRSEKERIKAFMSRTVDRFRPPFGRRVIEVPRQCVFAGTVNGSEYFQDETGNRRFWPVACSRIDIDGLVETRDQLWAEATSRYFGDEPWWLDSGGLIAAAGAEQEGRYIADPWRERLLVYLTDRSTVSLRDILVEGFGKQESELTRADQTRIGNELVSLGWRKRQVRKGEERIRLYESPKRQRDE